MPFTKITFGDADDTVRSAFEKVNDIIDGLASTSSGEGASQIGLYDSGGLYDATTVEDALAEIPTSASLSKSSVSSNDSTPGYLNGKLVAGEGIDLTEGTDGGNETLTISGEDASKTNKGVCSFAEGEGIDITASSGQITIAGEDATTSNKGILETATNTEAGTGTATDKALTPSNAQSLSLLDTQSTIYGRTETVRDGFDYVTRNGIVEGCTITDAGGLNITMTAGVGFVDGSLFTINALGTTALTDNATNYIYASKDDSSINISTTEPTGEFALREVCHTYGGDIHHCFEFPLMAGGLRYSVWKFLNDAMPAVVVSGCKVAVDTDATNPNDFTVSTGSYYINVLDSTTISSTLYSAGAGHGDNNVEAHYHSSSAWTTGSENGISFDYWDNGADKTADSVGKWYSGWIFLHGSTIVYVYPQTEHVLESDALAEDIVYPPYHQGYVLPIAQFVFRGGTSAFGATAFFVDIRPFFDVASPISGAVQNVYQTVTGDSGSTTASASDDSIAIVGTSPLSSAVTADTVTLSMTAANGATSGYVNADAQTFNGVKTFGSFPVTPSSAPTTDYQVANKKYVDDISGSPILGDGTAGRVLRKISIQIADGTNATTIKPRSINRWNGDANDFEDNLGKGGDTGVFTLSAGGNTLTLQAAGITGNCIAVPTATIRSNASATVLSVEGYVNGSDLSITFANASSGAAVDLTTLVDTGEIYTDICYLTSA